MRIKCPLCGKLVTVPEPDYEEVSPDQLRLQELEDALGECKQEITRLNEELEHVSLRRNHLEKLRARTLKCFERIDRDLADMEKTIQRIRAALLDAGYSPIPGPEPSSGADAAEES